MILDSNTVTTGAILYLLFLIAVWAYPALGGVTHEVTVGQQVHVVSGDTVRLKGENYSVTVSQAGESVKCAVPGRNCGSGYRPAHPTFTVTCPKSPCPYFFDADVNNANAAELVIHTEESCAALKHKAKTCFYNFSQTLRSVDECSLLKDALGRYYCVVRFNVAPAKFKDLCEQLPKDIYGLRGECFYAWAIRFNDAKFCAKYDPEDFSGSERCWLKMADLLKDKSLCRHVKKEPHYVEQCRDLK